MDSGQWMLDKVAKISGCNIETMLIVGIKY